MSYALPELSDAYTIWAKAEKGYFGAGLYLRRFKRGGRSTRYEVGISPPVGLEMSMPLSTSSFQRAIQKFCELWRAA